MPLYEFGCANGHVEEHLIRHPVFWHGIVVLPDEENPAACAACGAQLERILSLVVVHGFTPHYDEFAGQYFTSRADKRKKLALAGFAEKGDTGIRDKRGRIYSAPGVTKRGPTSVPYLN